MSDMHATEKTVYHRIYRLLDQLIPGFVELSSDEARTNRDILSLALWLQVSSKQGDTASLRFVQYKIKGKQPLSDVDNENEEAVELLLTFKVFYNATMARAVLLQQENEKLEAHHRSFDPVTNYLINEKTQVILAKWLAQGHQLTDVVMGLHAN